MGVAHYSDRDIGGLIKHGQRLPFAIDDYPSRGQSAVQELYQTKEGKFFLKRVSERNHQECRIDLHSGTLAERECWAYQLAKAIGFFVPPLWLMDPFTTVQVWFDCPDGKTFKKSTGRMELAAANVFDCAIFDWVTGQIDRHDANYLYDYKNDVVIPVDSAHAFLKYEGALPDYLHLFEIGNAKQLGKKMPSEAKRKLDALSDGDLQTLVPLKSGDEFDALVARRRVLSEADAIQDVLDLYRGKR